MSCHLHELLGQDRGNNGVMLAPGIDQGMLAHAKNKMAGAMCFDLGEIENIDEIPVAGEMVILPYENCWFEFSVSRFSKVAMLCTSLVDGNFLVDVFINPEKQGWIFLLQIQWEADACCWSMGVKGDAIPAIIGALTGLLKGICAINCVNIKRIKVDPSQKLQKARAKRGKKPLFSYWTLDIDLKKYEQGEWLGGAHASPRVHLRRGHVAVRQHGPHKGKWWWVQPCIVRGSTPGIVHKDYRLAA